MLIKYTCDSKSQTLRMCYPFQSTGRPISHRNRWSFRVYMIPLRDFIPEWKSRPGSRTGVNSRRGNSHRYDILRWYHVNKYRAMGGNRSELAPGRKSPRCHVNTPQIKDEKLRRIEPSWRSQSALVWPLAMSCLHAKISLVPSINSWYFQPYWSLQQTYQQTQPQSDKDSYAQTTDVWALFFFSK